MASFPSSGSPAPFPEKVGKYELLLPIGTGGMATVYLARTIGAGGFTRDVALKLVHSHLRADEECKLQLLEEAKLAARIRHPNVVPVHEVDEDPFGLFLVMDYVEGDNLSGVVRGARTHGETVSNRLFARILNDALLGLHAAHELRDIDDNPLNLVHRDFSPQNILLSIQGITRLGDFGVAKAADRAIRTKTGLVKGKISYMSPEQARGHALDRRCDVWAAGVVAWELLARRRMHVAEDEVTTLLRIVTEMPPRLSSVRPDIPPAVDEAVAWALSPQLSERCPTAEDFRLALEAAWQSEGGMADVSEVAEFVDRVVGPRLRERQSSIAEVRTLRIRMGELVRPQPGEVERTLSEERPRAQQRSRPRLTPVPPARAPSSSRPTLTEVITQSGTHADSNVYLQQHPSSVATPAPHSDRTETSAEVPTARANNRSRRLTLVGGALAGACLTLGGMAVVNSLLPDPPTAAAARPAPRTELGALTPAPAASLGANSRPLVNPVAGANERTATQSAALQPPLAAAERLDPSVRVKPAVRKTASENAGATSPPIQSAVPQTKNPLRAEKASPAASASDQKNGAMRAPNRKPGLASSPYPGSSPHPGSRSSP